MPTANPIKFTLLIASKNEETDIHLAIESALAQTYPHKEIICVDDSTDNTRDIIRRYEKQGVVLIAGRGAGCCQARNLGISCATGDVIVFLNADTKPDPDHLERIRPYYEQGYDWVTTGDLSYNYENIYSLFIEVQSQLEAALPDYNPLETSGFSVRKNAAVAVGMISGGDYPVNFCRYWTLGKKLEAAGYKKKHDQSLVVPHKSPDNFKEYWQVRKTRGLMSAYQPYFFFHRSPFYLFIKFSAKSALALLHFGAIFPAVRHVAALARYAPRPKRDFFRLYYAYFLNILARCVGEWQGWFFILKQ